MVDLWGMSGRTCMQSFVVLRIKKALGIFTELTITTKSSVWGSGLVAVIKTCNN